MNNNEIENLFNKIINDIKQFGCKGYDIVNREITEDDLKALRSYLKAHGIKMRIVKYDTMNKWTRRNADNNRRSWDKHIYFIKDKTK